MESMEPAKLIWRPNILYVKRWEPKTSFGVKVVERKEDELTRIKDTKNHGGWEKATQMPMMTWRFSVALEFGSQTYLKAKKDGTIKLGRRHSEGDPPAAEEIFTGYQVKDGILALMSGYGKYLTVTEDGKIVGRSDFVNQTERFQPTFKWDREAVMSLLAGNKSYVSVDPKDGFMIARAKTPGASEHVQMRFLTDNPNESIGKPKIERKKLKTNIIPTTEEEKNEEKCTGKIVYRYMKKLRKHKSRHT